MNNKIILPSYVTKLPSSGKSVSYRPFTVKEEKTLLLALEENDLLTISNAIKNTIRVCTDSAVDPDNVPYYDVEYLFLQIRSKSVGETVELMGTCDCKHKTTFSVDISNTIVEGNTSVDKIKIPGTEYSVKIRHPSLSNFVSAMTDDAASGTETVASCIVSVYSEEEVFDWSFKEKLEFVESMTPLQQKDIAAFLDRMPTVKLDASFTCEKCGLENKQTLSGFENFFL